MRRGQRVLSLNWRASQCNALAAATRDHKKTIRSSSCVKSVHIVFGDAHGLLIGHAITTGTVVNGDYYARFIRYQLCPAICRKQTYLLQSGPIIRQEVNTRTSPHETRSVCYICWTKNTTGISFNTRRIPQTCPFAISSSSQSFVVVDFQLWKT